MKIIQSFWTKPKLSKEHLEKTKAFYKLSALYLSKNNFEVELFTDKLGAEILKDISSYSKIHVVLDEINYFSEHLWSAAKIYSMLRIRGPVIHIDGDVFIKKPNFLTKILNENWDVLVQSQEISEHWYYQYDKSLDIFNSLCQFENIFQANTLKQYNYTYNLGVFGFRDEQKLKIYASIFFKLANYLNRNIQIIEKYQRLKDNRPWVRGAKVDINCIIEQVQLTFFANYYNLYVKEIMPQSEWSDFEWQFFQNVNEEIGYEHLAGKEKYQETEAYKKVLKYLGDAEVEESSDYKSVWFNY